MSDESLIKEAERFIELRVLPGDYRTPRELAEELLAALRRAEAERDELRATVTRLNRRAQTAEAGVRDNVEACKAAGKSMGRTLANAAADMYLRRAEQAEAERDAQHAEVLRLTGERDAVAKDLARIRAVSAIAGSVARWDSLLNEMHKQKAKVSELTATRDLLTEENARLRKERDAAVEFGKGLERHSAESQRIRAERAEEKLAAFTGSADRVLRLEAERYVRADEIAQLRAQIATLELLRRGGK